MTRAGSRLSTRANALTASRLVLGPLLLLALLERAVWPAFALFWLAVGSDLLDGRVARRYGEAPALLPAAVALAFLQYALDSRVIRGSALRASALGRWNGIAYFVPVGTVVVRDALGIAWPAPRLVLWLGWALFVSTLLSMADRALALRRAPGPGRAPGSRV
jgi:phosphatidylglycerophosphate synthase